MNNFTNFIIGNFMKVWIERLISYVISKIKLGNYLRASFNFLNILKTMYTAYLYNYPTKRFVLYNYLCQICRNSNKLKIERKNELLFRDVFTLSAGTLLGITNSVATIPGILSPYITGIIISANVRIYLFVLFSILKLA